MSVQAGHIYLIPPGKDMIVSEGKLLIAERSRENNLALPIDQFLRSLAQEKGAKSIGVILSGTGTDGSRGIGEIHAAGGLVLAQDVESAKFDGMPKAAVNTGAVDMILNPEAMADQIASFLDRPGEVGCGDDSHESVTMPVEHNLRGILRLLRNKYGIDFSHYKSGTISRRVERRLMLNQVYDLDDYTDRLTSDTEELDKLYRDLLIGVTRFFRDSEAFEKLHRDIIKPLISEATAQDEVRFWIAGTGTGEEAYSLAMLISEELEKHPQLVPVRIFATDVHNRSLEFAARGIYTEDNLQDVPAELAAKYFIKRKEGYQVSPHLRKMIVFAPHNIIRDAPFTSMDFISCRNLLIYLRPEAQKKALSLFHFALKVGGALWLGPSETLGDLEREFEVVDEHWRVFHKRRDVRILAGERAAMKSLGGGKSQAGAGATRGLVAHQLETYDRLLEEFMPPSILVTDCRDLLHTFSGASKYLMHKDGRPTSDVVELVQPDLRVPLLTALQRCIKDQAPVVHAGVNCEAFPEDEIKLVVKPFFNRTANRNEYLVIFNVSECKTREGSVPSIDLKGISIEQIQALEAELQYAKESLHATIEELETTNEELQSSNEELLASNEELQSTNEELNSVNEELYTVNMEHQRKISELTEMTDDMENLLNSTEVDTVFLDREFRIRKFTPGIAKTFNLIPQDVGRRIDSFTHNVKNLALLDALERVLHSEEPLELEVGDGEDEWYLLRILPYFSKMTIEGLVMTLINITSLKSAEMRLTELSEIVQQSSDAIIRFDLGGMICTWNPGASEILGYSEDEAVGKHFSMLMPENSMRAAELLLHEVAEGNCVNDHRTMWHKKDGTPLEISLHVSPIRNVAKEVSGASAIARDISELKKAEHEIREAIRRRDQFLAMLSHELRNPFAAILNANSLLKEADVDQHTTQEAREVVEHQLQHVSRLLDDLLDVARVANDKLVLHTEVIDISKIVVDVVDCIQHQLEICDQQLELNQPDVPFFVDGDIGRLQQAQVNLLVNASKYSPRGSTIHYSVSRDGGEVVIQVSDSGDGIPPEIADRIFEPFVQAEQTIDRSQGGMGLGLPLVRMIVEAHGGTVAVKSHGKGKGSEFTIRLPLTAAPPANQRTSDFNIPSGTRLLLIEDSDGIRRMLARSLELKGFAVQSAKDGLDGLTRFGEFQPQVAIVDIGLPDIDGFEVARRVRAQFSESALLVAVTGYGQDQDRRKALDAGFDMHLVKPIDPMELASTIAPFLIPSNSIPAS